MIVQINVPTLTLAYKNSDGVFISKSFGINSQVDTKFLRKEEVEYYTGLILEDGLTPYITIVDDSNSSFGVSVVTPTEGETGEPILAVDPQNSVPVEVPVESETKSKKA
jgi:hypothetical protein